MENYYKKISMLPTPLEKSDGSKQTSSEFDLSSLPTDPGLRPRILDYSHDVRDKIRRAYLQKGPCQPRGHEFPFKPTGRRFIQSWFDEYKVWLEYSIVKNAAFCLYCYLFKPVNGQQGGGDSFVGKGFSNWRKKDTLTYHAEKCSAHQHARRCCEALLNQAQHIETIFSKHSDEARIQYRIRLNASVDCARFLLRQGLAFRGDKEYEESSNRGNFLELYRFLADHNENIKATTLQNAPENLKLTAHDIQKDIVHALAIETTDTIIREMGDALFSILIDESRDVSTKEINSLTWCKKCTPKQYCKMLALRL